MNGKLSLLILLVSCIIDLTLVSVVLYMLANRLEGLGDHLYQT